eukprot:CAMPEP_0170518308 /NCGR_PEP_ID=MMETSP0209-20121228/4026_1 /TAXON_ID=665100 ORGANISM="Litonotus pictus, Strain P1" /NCGR_SAMPLE_ID=MMETSP0209 /ASSEMBLY_ACC=CAM_ASM_000301 /LENGTH=1233 /DNA_ID=CAMNT_0010803817 /DNA_START=787 /DNA_END=4488 /DNA_ORIENTATION=-
MVSTTHGNESLKEVLQNLNLRHSSDNIPSANNCFDQKVFSDEFEINNNYFEVYISFLEFQSNKPLYQIELYNITKVKIAEMTIKEQSIQKQKVLSKVAHEFKTPLYGIISLCRNLRDLNYEDNSQNKDNSKIQGTNMQNNEGYKSLNDYTQNIENISTYVVFLVTDFIQTSKGKEFSVDIKKTDLKEVAMFSYNILDTLLYVYNRKGKVTPSIYIDPLLEDYEFLSDEIRLKQVLLNILSNSVKFTKFGEISITMKIFFEAAKEDNSTVEPSENPTPKRDSVENTHMKIEENNIDQSQLSPPNKIVLNNKKLLPKLEIKIVDSGSGMGPSQLSCIKERAFDNITVSNSNSNLFGTGLGLSISFLIAEKLDMLFDVDSEINKGTVSTLTLKSENYITKTADLVMFQDRSDQAEEEENSEERSYYVYDSNKSVMSEDGDIDSDRASENSSFSHIRIEEENSHAYEERSFIQNRRRSNFNKEPQEESKHKDEESDSGSYADLSAKYNRKVRIMNKEKCRSNTSSNNTIDSQIRPQLLKATDTQNSIFFNEDDHKNSKGKEENNNNTPERSVLDSNFILNKASDHNFKRKVKTRLQYNKMESISSEGSFKGNPTNSPIKDRIQNQEIESKLESSYEDNVLLTNSSEQTIPLNSMEKSESFYNFNTDYSATHYNSNRPNIDNNRRNSSQAKSNKLFKRNLSIIDSGKQEPLCFEASSTTYEIKKEIKPSLVKDNKKSKNDTLKLHLMGKDKIEEESSLSSSSSENNNSIRNRNDEEKNEIIIKTTKPMAMRSKSLNLQTKRVRHKKVVRYDRSKNNIFSQDCLFSAEESRVVRSARCLGNRKRRINKFKLKKVDHKSASLYNFCSRSHSCYTHRSLDRELFEISRELSYLVTYDSMENASSNNDLNLARQRTSNRMSREKLESQRNQYTLKSPQVDYKVLNIEEENDRGLIFDGMKKYNSSEKRQPNVHKQSKVEEMSNQLVHNEIKKRNTIQNFKQEPRKKNHKYSNPQPPKKYARASTNNVDQDTQDKRHSKYKKMISGVTGVTIINNKNNKERPRKNSNQDKIRLSQIYPNRNIINSQINTNQTGGLNKENSQLIAKQTVEILVVDDSKLIRTSLTRSLQKQVEALNMNCLIHEGTDGIDILKFIKEDQEQGNKIKLVFTDETMDYMNGSEALMQLKKLEKESKIKSLPPIICVTAYEDDSIKSHFLNVVGFADVIEKNPRKEKLERLLKTFFLK